MAESLLSYALTTVQRLKDRLVISGSTHDTQLQRLANGITDFIESYCNRRFLRTTYTQEVYSIHAKNARFLILRNAPVASISAFQYSIGTPSNKSWTDYSADDYELVENGKSGLIRCYATLPYGTNTVRVTYAAGYLINFGNAGDNSTHTLPADLTEVAERMIVRAFKRRDNEGKDTESFDGGSVTWSKYLTDDDKVILAKYERLPEFY